MAMKTVLEIYTSSGVHLTWTERLKWNLPIWTAL